MDPEGQDMLKMNSELKGDKSPGAISKEKENGDLSADVFHITTHFKSIGLLFITPASRPTFRSL